MPYTTKNENGKYKVYKKGDNGEPTGDSLGSHDTDKEAQDQIGAIESEEREKKLKRSSKGWYNKLPQSKVNYNPVGGIPNDKMCANCHWFNVYDNTCTVVEGDISPTGLSDLWMAVVEYEPEPIPVKIVGNTEDEYIEIDTKEKQPNLFNKVVSWLFGSKKEKKEATKDEKIEISLGFKTLPDNKWIASWTNNFLDLNGEIFSEKSIDEYIERVDKGIMPYPELWYRHLPVPFGAAEWLGRTGHLTFAVGRFYDTEVGRKMYDHYSNRTDSIPLSHGYLYPKELKEKTKEGNVYWSFNTYEISTLEPGEAANPLTEFGVLEKGVKEKMDNEKITALEKIIPAELARVYLQYGEKKSQELERLGLTSKALETTENKPDNTLLTEAIKELVTSQKKINEDQTSAIQMLVNQVKEMTGVVKKVDDLESSFKEFKQQINEQLSDSPRASSHVATKVGADSPYLKELQEVSSGQKSVDIFQVIEETLTGRRL